VYHHETNYMSQSKFWRQISEKDIYLNLGG